MGRGPILGTKQLKYECSLSEEMAPAKCTKMVVESGAETLLDVRETCWK